MNGKNGQWTAPSKSMDKRNGQDRWTAPNGRKEWTLRAYSFTFQRIAPKMKG